MEIGQALKLFEDYNLWVLIIGLALLITTVSPRLLADNSFSMPMVLLILGYVIIALPLGLEAPNLEEHGTYTEHITELGVILALMGAGLKIDRPFSFKGWSSTWRLLGITMIISIGLSVMIGWWIAAFVPATAMLLGAVIAPTDPVLAEDVEVGAPGEGVKDEKTLNDLTEKEEEDEVRFSLTSEAGLNDGLAFPFTHMAIAMTIFGAHPENWIEAWFLIHVLYELIVAIVIGIGLGYLLALVIMVLPSKTSLAKSIIGLGALASTLVIYGLTEYFGGYGFIATFVGAIMIRRYKPDHPYHTDMHIFIEKSQRIFTAIILIGLGAAVADGLLGPLNWVLILSAVLIIFVVRPLAGVIGLIGFKKAPWRERLAISFLGIRGIGSIYYLIYALNREDFSGADELWALVALVIILSAFTHGITATPIIQKLDKMRGNN